jgi:hypothetical protein
MKTESGDRLKAQSVLGIFDLEVNAANSEKFGDSFACLSPNNFSSTKYQYHATVSCFKPKMMIR